MQAAGESSTLAAHRVRPRDRVSAPRPWVELPGLFIATILDQWRWFLCWRLSPGLLPLQSPAGTLSSLLSRVAFHSHCTQTTVGVGTGGAV